MLNSNSFVVTPLACPGDTNTRQTHAHRADAVWVKSIYIIVFLSFFMAWKHQSVAIFRTE